MACRSLCSLVSTRPLRRVTEQVCSAEAWYPAPSLLRGAATPSLYGLCYSTGPSSHASAPPTDGSSNLLLKQLRDQIRMTGPLTVHQYMRAVLTHPRGGYYMERDVLGRAGDFITSPEISQMFGELVGVWVYSEWHKMGRVQPLQLVELGPGRGTLTMDVLRVLSQLGLSGDAVQIHLVEVSPYYRDMQRRTLCGESSSKNESPPNSSLKTSAPSDHKKNYIDQSSPSSDDPIDPIMSDVTVTKSPVHWHDQLDCVPPGFSMIIAHEFFDCLPIHRLVKKDGNKWREVLVDINGDVGYGGYGDAAGTEGHGKIEGGTNGEKTSRRKEVSDGKGDTDRENGGRSKDADGREGGTVEEKDGRRSKDADGREGETVEEKDGRRSKDADGKSLVVMGSDEGDGISPSEADLPLRYVISRTSTPASTLYTEALEDRESAEVSPEAALLMQQIGRRLQERGGALLMVDYGHSGTKGDTFRAFRQHRQEHPLAAPGTADLTADVDFALLKASLPDSVMTFGPVTQAFFLKNMGIELRLMKLVQSCRDPQQRKVIVSGYKRLLEDLGASFKVMAVYPSVMKDLLHKIPPPGFYRNLEGDWQGEENNDPDQAATIAKLKTKMFEPKLGDGSSEQK